ncbi:hybrid sensor histidine kinase/response regulator [Methylocystis heyeri]|uniref:Chemotaxis protein CheA n=1 Tax=Methylocystis heyeri TaxID=391905 RepID=A0A6B8KJU1_9HYPH|nr:hybrid sensor histidine kinase/response regulator [Methylocystis heyeri]QGM47809.1 hybrid sensor histidine kinase/response regulator [Methylocystis heyeri]
MDDLLSEFLAESAEHIDAASMDLLRLEKDPADSALVASLFRHVHTIKGSSGFLSLPRIGRLTHSVEAFIGGFREGAQASPEHVSLMLRVVDRLTLLLAETGRLEAEPEGEDSDLLQEVEAAQARLLQGARSAGAVTGEGGAKAVTPLEAPDYETDAPAGRYPRAAETVRVPVGVLDRLMGIVSELVLTRNQLLDLSSAAGDERIKGSVQNLSSATGDLQDAVMRVRLQPVGMLFATLPRLVRDLSMELGKEIRLETAGAETELDRQVIEIIRAPLTHIVRNAADHGVEPVSRRIAAGKPPAGLIRVAASYDAGQITLQIKDDGRGLDIARIKETARKRGLAGAEALERMSDADLYQFVLAPGFSTATKVTKVSGRGVGMDVVRENIQSIGGTVSISSRAGVGATVTLRIPLTLAIAPALIVFSGGLRFAVPQMAVAEVVGVGEGFDSEIQFMHQAPILTLRGDALPLVDLARTLEVAAVDETRFGQRGFVVVLRLGGVRFGLMVENIADVQEVVIEPLVGALARIGIFSGQTILGDGSAVLMLDPAVVLERAGVGKMAESPSFRAAEPLQEEKRKTGVVLFRAGAGALKALPMSLVLRIEEVEAGRLLRSGDLFVTLEDGRPLPVIPASDDIVVGPRPYPLLLLAGGEPLGLLVEEVVDVREEFIDFLSRGPNEKIAGVANLAGEVVEFLDAGYLFDRADPPAIARAIERRPRVLLAHGEQIVLDMLGLALAGAGYEASVATSGREALALIEQGLEVEALVTDVDMEVAVGHGLARAFLALPGCAGKPVIGLARHAAPEVLEAAAAEGIRAVARKLDRGALLGFLENFIGLACATGDRAGAPAKAEIAA